jgi:outer membrane receptor for ferric coprogen and ferric-rhodotorulic acid
LRKYRKLQGPFCKTKFPVDLRPKWRNAQNESWRVFQTLQHYFRAQVQKLKTYIFTHESLNKSRIWIAFVLKV